MDGVYISTQAGILGLIPRQVLVRIVYAFSTTGFAFGTCVGKVRTWCCRCHTVPGGCTVQHMNGTAFAFVL